MSDPYRVSSRRTLGKLPPRLLTLILLSWLLAAPAPAGDGYWVYAREGMIVLQGWYNSSNGRWNTTGWWNSANALETVIDYSARTRSSTYRTDISNTFDRNKDRGFLNRYYDDEGWWALTWIKAYDLTKESRYLEMAKSIFNDMKGGWDGTCGGGIWWNKDRKYKNAIANELFLTLAARLHLRTPGDGGPGSYRDWAEREWAWFSASGMINSHNLVNDGLNASCANNGGTTWSYNQGVILGGLIEMYHITHHSFYRQKARAIANAAISSLVNSRGILKEPCEDHGDCGGDGPQFKGIFIRNLGYLNTLVRANSYQRFLRRNADSIWAQDRSPSNQFGLRWGGPFDKADASRQSAALDAILAAASK